MRFNLKFIPVPIMVMLLFTACGTLQVRIDQTSPVQTTEPDGDALATIQSLQTQNAQLAAQPDFTPEPTRQLLNLQSDPETIRQKMLFSHRNWNQVWLDGTFTYYSADGVQVEQQDHIQIWVDQPTFRFRALIAPQGNQPQRYLVSDGQSVLQMDLQTGQTETYSLPPDASSYQDPSVEIDDSIEPHPLGSSLGTPFSDALFPTGLAQRGGYYVPINIETAAGHPALVIDWYRFQPGERVDRFWLDIQTGIILKWQNYTKQGGEVLNSEMIINQITYNPSFPDHLFQIPPSTIPSFAVNASGSPDLSAFAESTPASNQPDPLGELYFTLLSNTLPDPSLRLVRLPGSCVVGLTPCPAVGPEGIPSYPNRNASIVPLTWSHDGSQAIVAFPSGGDASSKTIALYLFEPTKISWQVLAEMLVIEQPSWSPDGEWIIFQGQEDQSRDLFAIHPDGSNLKNLTDGKLTGDFEVFIMGGWLQSKYLFAFGNPTEARLYLLDPDQAKLTEFNAEFPPGKGQLMPSPDSSHIALSDYSGNGASLKILDANGRFVNQLANFQNASLNLHAWSPDSQQLLFSVNASSSNDVYIVGVDGSDLRQVYQGKAILVSAFSANGEYVVIEDDNATGIRLYIYSLKENRYFLLNAPDLNLTDAWRSPSWRPIVGADN